MKTLIIQALICSLAIPVSSAVWAQSDDDDEANASFEEIIVTSNRRDKNIMEVNQSVQAIPESVLQLPTFNDLNDITTLVPGATAYSNKPPQKEGIQFRGSGISQASVADGLSPVGYYVDDIPFVDISTPVPPPIGTFDLERIEVMRGPQGTTYGQDSSAGSIIMRTNPVDLQDFGYRARVGVSDIKGYSGTGYTVGGVLNIPIAEDKFGIRLSYLQEEDPGYGEVVNRPDIENPLESTRDSIRVKALWQITDRASIEFTHSEWNTTYGFLPATGIADTLSGSMTLWEPTAEMLLGLYPDGNVQNEFEIRWSTLLAKFDLGFAEFTSSTGFVDTPLKQTHYQDQNPDPDADPELVVVIYNQPADTFSQEFRLVSTNDGSLHWIAGLFYMDANSDSSGYVDFPSFAFRSYATDPINSEVFAAFGDVEYDINDQWTVQLGLRYQDEERSDTYREDIADVANDPLFGPYSFAGEPVTTATTFSHTSYRLGVTWNPSDNGMVYLTNSLANRAPIIQGQQTLDQLEAAGMTVPGDANAAELMNTEIGTKWTMADGRLQMELAYVFSDWSDIPLWVELDPALFPPWGLSLGIGGTDAEINIFEASFNFAMTDNLRVNYGVAFTDTKVTKIPDDAAVVAYPAAVVLGGELFNYSPTTHNFGINFDHTLGNAWDLFVSLNYVIRDKPDGIDAFDLGATEFVPARDKFENLSFSIGANKDRLGLSFSIDNLTDFTGMAFPSSSQYTNGFIGQPMTYSLQLTYDGMQ